MRRVLTAMAATVLATLCTGCGSYKGDMQMMCDAPKQVSPIGLSPEQRAEKIALHIAKNTRSAEARKAFQALSTVPESDRVRVLEQAVREAGLDPAQCEMLRYYQ